MIKREFGADREPGFFPGGRLEISRKLTRRIRLALDYFGGHNNITELGDFDVNVHQLGPLAEISLHEHWLVMAGILYGVSPASDNLSYRLNIQYGF